MTTWRDLKRQVAGASRARVLLLHAAKMQRDAFVSTAARVVAVANAKTTHLADVALAEHLGRLPVGITPPDDVDRLETAFGTVLDDAEANDTDPSERLGRIAWAEPLAAAAVGWGVAMRAQGVPGWTRIAAPDACPACSEFADGTVLPPTTEMWTHTGCSCTAEPVP